MKKETMIKLKQVLTDDDILDISFEGCPIEEGIPSLICDGDMQCGECWLKAIKSVN